jgi:hypothetical protein
VRAAWEGGGGRECEFAFRGVADDAWREGAEAAAAAAADVPVVFVTVVTADAVTDAGVDEA